MNKFMLNETSYHGAGAINAIPDEIKSRGFKKAFVASDPDLVKFGVSKKVTDILDKEGIEYKLYTDIKANPTIENVQHGVEEFKACGADCIVAIGGGSSMDTAKAIGIIITNPEFADVRSLEGVAPTKNKCVPIIAVPTTAGTAAEVTINYVITDVEKKRKFVCVDAHDIPVVAVVDPDRYGCSYPRYRGLHNKRRLGAFRYVPYQGYRDYRALSARRSKERERRQRRYGSRPVHRRNGLLKRRSRC